MKGHMEDGKFHPHTDYKKGTRKSRDQTVKTQGVIIERKAREPTDTSILNDLVNDFNRKGLTKIEYGNIGGQARGLKKEGSGSFIAESMSKKEAINCLRFTIWIMDRKMESNRLKRDEPLPPFVKKEIIENLADLDLMLKGLRDERRDRNLGGDKATGELTSQIRLIGGARNSILSLLDQVPEPLHREIAEGAHKIYMEYKE